MTIYTLLYVGKLGCSPCEMFAPEWEKLRLLPHVKDVLFRKIIYGRQEIDSNNSNVTAILPTCLMGVVKWTPFFILMPYSTYEKFFIDLRVENEKKELDFIAKPRPGITGEVSGLKFNCTPEGVPYQQGDIITANCETIYSWMSTAITGKVNTVNKQQVSTLSTEGTKIEKLTQKYS